MVVTMFWISELACASRIGMVLIRIVEFGISSVTACSSANAARGSYACFQYRRGFETQGTAEVARVHQMERRTNWLELMSAAS